MVSDLNNELIKRHEMDTGAELRYLARRAASKRTGSISFLEHAYYHFVQQKRNEACDTHFSDILDAKSKDGSSSEL